MTSILGLLRRGNYCLELSELLNDGEQLSTEGFLRFGLLFFNLNMVLSEGTDGGGISERAG